MKIYHIVPSSDVLNGQYKWKVKRGESTILQEYKDKRSAIAGALIYADGGRVILHRLDGGVRVID